MVRIAVAGGAGNVGQEVIDVLAATKKHEILLLSRKDAPTGEELPPGVTWVKTNYEDLKGLIETLRGVDTVLSFIVAHADPGAVAQKKLIDAAVRAGVRRFAPSEWAMRVTLSPTRVLSLYYSHANLDLCRARFDYMPWYEGKALIREYLKELNKDKKILEYSLFQPGLFTDYLTYPYKSTKHIHPMQTPIDFGSRRMLMVEGSEDVPITLTTAADLANVVARAVEYEGEWPAVGGIKGDELTIREVIDLGKKVRGEAFQVEKLKADDLKAGVVRATWLPRPDHPSYSTEQVEALAEQLTAGITLGFASGAMSVSDEWNRLLPDYQFTKAGDYLVEAWRGKP
ncbi:NAD(P)-binding protein [Corynascus novoguineensis]|uniref:NAD(P)-binding protein n=1 Tax=Corynascus novoguineensis TaxID=1126955 RepID=A0AAN7CR27_9PEZI|nr:NAD(P)-binding protein [Corynascus novoguineensis]